MAHGFSRGGGESGTHSSPPSLKRWATQPSSSGLCAGELLLSAIKKAGPPEAETPAVLYSTGCTLFRQSLGHPNETRAGGQSVRSIIR